jgi:hypothetical protein
MPTSPETTSRSTTRRSLQAVAEYVLSAALHAANGHIGLRRTPGGFGTPEFDHAGDRRQILVDGTDLEVRDGASSRRAPITTLRACGELVGIEPGAPREVYTPATVLDLAAPLALDANQARVLADWYTLVDEALAVLRSEAAGRAPATTQLWPEHFDLATTIDEVNFGGSPGDDGHDLPYRYVGPWNPPSRDEYWNETLGASRSAAAIDSVEDVLSFFREGRGRLR